MKKTVTLFVCLFIIAITPFKAQQLDVFFNDADAFFKGNVVNEKINYQQVKSNPTVLNNLISQIETATLDSLSNNEKKAFYINAYNLLVIKNIIDYYPINSPLEIGNFFDTKNNIVAQKKLSLNQLEKEIIFPTFNDNRLHFVLVCGALGCPPILNAAYLPSKLETQINQQTSAFINGNGVLVNTEKNTVSLSEIFKWYDNDFNTKKTTKGAFINSYRNEKIPIGLKVVYLKYDWSLNDINKQLVIEEIKDEPTKRIQEYTPSLLISKGQSEIKMFNNLYTQKKFFDENSNKISEGKRSSFFTSIMEYNVGLSNNFTIGGELWLKSVKIDSTDANPLSTLTMSNSPSARTAVSGLGIKVKFNPIKKWTRLSMQSTLLVNVLPDPESRDLNQPFLDANRHQWITKLFYDKPFGAKFQLFTQLSAWVDIDKEFGSESSGVATPLDLFFSYFATKKITFYVQNQVWPSFGSDGLSSYFIQEGVGLKYQLFNGFELETLYTSFVYGESSGAGQTFNLGFRVLY